MKTSPPRGRIVSCQIRKYKVFDSNPAVILIHLLHHPKCMLFAVCPEANLKAHFTIGTFVAKNYCFDTMHLIMQSAPEGSVLLLLSELPSFGNTQPSDIQSINSVISANTGDFVLLVFIFFCYYCQIIFHCGCNQERITR